jgi:predicted DNA-binding transcriptional regulator YafY
MRYHPTRPLMRRMQEIYRALRAGRWPTAESLANELNVDLRTIRRDIEFMLHERNAPIEYDRARRGYYYAEPTYQLSLVQMTEEELLGLYLSERMLRQFHGTPFEPDLRQAIAKLADMLPDNVTVRLDSIGDFLSVLPAVDAEYDPDSFCALLRAVVGQRLINMVYWTASRNETPSRLFDPDAHSFVNDRWDAFGNCHRCRKIRIVAAERALSVGGTGEASTSQADRPVGTFME